MGFFSPPKDGQLYYPPSGGSQMVSHPQLNRRRSSSKSPERSESESQPPITDSTKDSEGEGTDTKATGDEGEKQEGEGEDKPKEKKILKVKNRERFDPKTSRNTHYNSLIYHTSEDSIDLYARENDSSDLLGRIYYDDFDSDSLKSPAFSNNATPLISPTGSVIGNDYFSSRPTGATGTPSLMSPGSSKNASFTNLKTSGGLVHPAHEKKFERGISFDTSTNIERISLTLKAKHPKFKFRRNNKTFLTGYNEDKESLQAIRWLFDEMIINGDTIVVLQVLDEKMHHEIDRKKCNKTLEMMQDLNVHNKKVSIVYEIVVGKIQKLLKKAIDEYSPQMMAIGTHEVDKESKGFFSKTPTSKHFLQYALVPVIVVKPSYNHIEDLQIPVEDPDYFKNWLINIDISDTYIREKDKKNKKKMIKSPLSSRSSSYLNLSGANEERGRQRAPINVANNIDDNKFRFHMSPSRSRSSSRSQLEPTERSDSKSGKRSAFSKLFHH